jgi:hypothetical protein
MYLGGHDDELSCQDVAVNVPLPWKQQCWQTAQRLSVTTHYTVHPVEFHAIFLQRTLQLVIVLLACRKTRQMQAVLC